MVTPRSPYFRQYSTTREQGLLDGLITESIFIHGWETYYIPRVMKNRQKLYDTSDVDVYEDTYPIPVYLENVMSFKGDREMMSKWASTIELRDQVILGIAKTTFDQEIGVYYQLARPREGDLIFFPFNNRLFQIKYVDKFETLFQLGIAPYCWRVTAELFEYSNEILRTGIDEIDNTQKTYTTNLYDNAMKDTDGYFLKFNDGDIWMIDGYNLEVQDPSADNDDVQDMTANTVKVWTTNDPYEEEESNLL